MTPSIPTLQLNWSRSFTSYRCFYRSVTVGVVTLAIIGCVGSWIADGFFTRDVDVNVNIKIEWEGWLAIVNANSYYTQQGTQYLRIMNETGPGESTKLLPNAPKLGFLFDFTGFLKRKLKELGYYGK